MLHADPHPGNYRLLADGRLGVLDFGLVARLPEGLPTAIGHLLRLALEGDACNVAAGLREEGFVRPDDDIDAADLLEYLEPFLDPIRQEQFHFTREWMREQMARVGDPRSASAELSRRLNLPPSYLLVHRVWISGIGVLCQLDAEGPFRRELEEWVPGFAVAACPPADAPPHHRTTTRGGNGDRVAGAATDAPGTSPPAWRGGPSLPLLPGTRSDRAAFHSRQALTGLADPLLRPTECGDVAGTTLALRLRQAAAHSFSCVVFDEQ